MRRFVVLVVALGTLIVPATAGAGSDVNRKSPPHLSLRFRGDVVQRADPYTYCWSYSSGNSGTGMCADGFPRYPRAVEVPEGSRLRIRIHYPAKPERWHLNAYRAIVRHEHYDETTGESEKIPFRLRPYRVDGAVKAWDLVFRVEEPMRHYYFDTGGDLRQGDVFYALHVRTT